VNDLTTTLTSLRTRLEHVNKIAQNLTLQAQAAAAGNLFI